MSEVASDVMSAASDVNLVDLENYRQQGRGLLQQR